MKDIIIGGLAAGSLTVLLCTSSAGAVVRNWIKSVSDRAHTLVCCCFCSSWWISIAMLQEFSFVQWAATVAVANLTVLGIHAAMSTVEAE
jgi:hypothetical protein